MIKILKKLFSRKKEQKEAVKPIRTIFYYTDTHHPYCVTDFSDGSSMRNDIKKENLVPMLYRLDAYFGLLKDIKDGILQCWTITDGIQCENKITTVEQYEALLCASCLKKHKEGKYK